MVLFSDNCSTIVNPDDICGSRFVTCDGHYEIHLYFSGDYTEPMILEYLDFNKADDDYWAVSCMLLDRVHVVGGDVCG